MANCTITHIYDYSPLPTQTHPNPKNIIFTFTDNNALVTQYFAQSLHLVFEFANQFGVGVFVDDGLADDLLGSVRVANKIIQWVYSKLTLTL